MSDNNKASPWDRHYPAHLSWRMSFTPSTLPAVMANAVKKYANAPAMTFLGRTWTYADLGQKIDAFAQGLQSLGFGPGTRVGLCLPNSPFYVIAYYGALKIGAIVVNFNPLSAEKEIAWQIKDSGTEVLVSLNVPEIQPKVETLFATTDLKKNIFCTLPEVLPFWKGMAFRTLQALRFSPPSEDSRHVAFARLMRMKGDVIPVAVQPEDVAVLQYTGGTTGVPKAAVLTHAHLTINVEQTCQWFTGGARPDFPVRMLAVLPFFHVFCMTVQMNLTFRMGGQLIMLPRFQLKNLLKTIDVEKPTIFAGVPTLYRAMTGASFVRRYDLSSLRLCLSGGAPLPESIRKDFKDLTGLDLIEGYGLSETSPLIFSNPLKGQKKPLSVGWPMPGTEVKIVPLSPEEQEGEICVRGPQVMKAYWNRPEETEKVFDEQGFLRTGDIGYLDSEGYLFIVDRIKDMIIASGFKVFPRKVEEAILQHPAIAEAVAAGVYDAYRGETVKVWIVQKYGMQVTTEALKEFLKDKLAPYEMPKMIDFRDSLPKTLIGKPDRKALRAEEAKKKI